MALPPPVRPSAAQERKHCRRFGSEERAWAPRWAARRRCHQSAPRQDAVSDGNSIHCLRHWGIENLHRREALMAATVAQQLRSPLRLSKTCWPSGAKRLNIVHGVVLHTCHHGKRSLRDSYAVVRLSLLSPSSGHTLSPWRGVMRSKKSFFQPPPATRHPVNHSLLATKKTPPIPVSGSPYSSSGTNHAIMFALEELAELGPTLRAVLRTFLEVSI